MRALFAKDSPYKFDFSHIFFIWLLGGLIGPVGDVFHVLTGTTDYPQGVYGVYFWRLPFWVPLLFATASVNMALVSAWLDIILRRKRECLSQLSRTKIWLGIVCMQGHYALSGFLPRPAGGISDVIMALVFFVIWYAFCRTWQGLALALLNAILGCSFEIFIISKGTFWYNPGVDNFYGVASWLPWIYASAAVCVGNFGRYLASRHLEL